MSTLALSAFGDGGAGVARGGGGCHVAPGDRTAAAGTGATLRPLPLSVTVVRGLRTAVDRRTYRPVIALRLLAMMGVLLLCVEGLLHSPGELLFRGGLRRHVPTRGCQSGPRVSNGYIDGGGFQPSSLTCCSVLARKNLNRSKRRTRSWST